MCEKDVKSAEYFHCNYNWYDFHTYSISVTILNHTYCVFAVTTFQNIYNTRNVVYIFVTHAYSFITIGPVKTICNCG